MSELEKKYYQTGIEAYTAMLQGWELSNTVQLKMLESLGLEVRIKEYDLIARRLHAWQQINELKNPEEWEVAFLNKMKDISDTTIK